MRVKVSRRINAPASGIWPLIGDYSNINRIHPLLKGSHFIEGTQSCEVGSTRQCDMKNGDYIKERVIEWEEGSHYTVDVYETSMPVKDAVATFGVRELSKNQSEAYLDFTMNLKYAVLQPIMYLVFKYIAGTGILRKLEKEYFAATQVSLA